MVHGVAGGRLAIDLFVVNLEVLGHGSQLLGRAIQRQEARIEIGHVGLEHLGGVALRVHGHKNTLQAVTVLAQHLFDLGQFLHRRGAHVGALGVAKEHHHHLAGKVLDVARLAVVVGQGNVAGVFSAGDVHTPELGLFLGACTQEACSAER